MRSQERLCVRIHPSQGRVCGGPPLPSTMCCPELPKGHELVSVFFIYYFIMYLYTVYLLLGTSVNPDCITYIVLTLSLHSLNICGLCFVL